MHLPFSLMMKVMKEGVGWSGKTYDKAYGTWPCLDLIPFPDEAFLPSQFVSHITTLSSSIPQGWWHQLDLAVAHKLRRRTGPTIFCGNSTDALHTNSTNSLQAEDRECLAAISCQPANNACPGASIITGLSLLLFGISNNLEFLCKYSPSTPRRFLYQTDTESANSAASE